MPDEPSWRTEDTVRLAGLLAEHGVDFLDVSASALHPNQAFRPGVAYQAHFAEAVKKQLGDKLFVGSVGGIIDGKIAQEILDKGQADAVLVGRVFQKNPGAVWSFADDLDVHIRVARQIEWGGQISRPPANRN